MAMRTSSEFKTVPTDGVGLDSNTQQQMDSISANLTGKLSNLVDELSDLSAKSVTAWNNAAGNAFRDEIANTIQKCNDAIAELSKKAINTGEVSAEGIALTEKLASDFN